MAELVHLAQSFMNAEDAIIAKKRKRAKRMEAEPPHNSKQGSPHIILNKALVQRKPERERRRIETTGRQVRLQDEVSITHP